MKYNIDEIENRVREYIDIKRYAHTVSVAQTAACLAMKYGYETYSADDKNKDLIDRARLAGILHDNAKCMGNEKLIDICKNNNIEITASEADCPYLLHGKVGAFFAEKKYGIDDKEILLAIKNHTTGRPDMCLLEKIIFVADYIEPMRYKQKNLDYVRHLAFCNIDECIFEISKDTLEYLAGKNMCIDEMTVKTMNFYEVKNG